MAKALSKKWGGENGLSMPLLSFAAEGCSGGQICHTPKPELPSQAVVKLPESTLQTVKVTQKWLSLLRTEPAGVPPLWPILYFAGHPCRGGSLLSPNMVTQEPFPSPPGRVGLLAGGCSVVSAVKALVPITFSQPLRSQSSLYWATSHVSEGKTENL